MLALVSNTVEKLNLPISQGIYVFGKFAFPSLAIKMENRTNKFKHSKPSLLTLHDTIHVEVRKVMKYATPPDITYRDKLYDLVEGLLTGCLLYTSPSPRDS